MLTKAGETRNASEKASEKEKIEVAVIEAKLNSGNYEMTTEKLEEALRKEFGEEYGTLTGEGGWNYVAKSETYNISKEGKLTVGKQVLNYKIYGNSANLLPDEYQQVEYIESHGDERLDIIQSVPQPNYVLFDFNLKNSISSSVSSADCLFGASYGNSSGYYYQMEYNRFFLYHGYWSTGHNYRVNITNNTRYKIEISENSLIVNGNQTGEVTPNGSYNAGDNKFFTIFAHYYKNGDSIKNYGKFQLYEMLWVSKDMTAFHLIPCYKIEHGEIGMYDVARNIFFENASGTGEFTKGDNLNKKYPVGDKKQYDKYTILLKITTSSGEQNAKVTLSSPLRKVGDVADYLDLANKKVFRYIGEDEKVLATENITVENITIENLPEIKDIISIEVETEIQPSKIEIVE